MPLSLMKPIKINISFPSLSLLNLLQCTTFPSNAASKSGFSVATPNDTVDMHEFETTPPNSPYKFPSSISHSIALKRQSSLHYKRNKQYHQQQQQQQQSPQHELLHKQHPNRHSPNFDLIKQSSEPLHSTLVTDSLMYSSNGAQQQPNQQQLQQPRQSISNEAASEISTTTTALCCDSSTTDTSRRSSTDWRRHAMTITANPSYQVNRMQSSLHRFITNHLPISHVHSIYLSLALSLSSLFPSCTNIHSHLIALHCLNKKKI